MHINDRDSYAYESLQFTNETLRRELNTLQFENDKLQLEVEKARKELQVTHKISYILAEFAPEQAGKFICTCYKNYANQDDLPNVRDFIRNLHRMVCKLGHERDSSRSLK
jgi:hypothetical protein